MRSALLAVVAGLLISPGATVQADGPTGIRGRLEIGERDLNWLAESLTRVEVLHHLRTQAPFRAQSEARLLRFADGLLDVKSQDLASLGEKERADAYVSLILGDTIHGVVTRSAAPLKEARLKYDRLLLDKPALAVVQASYPALTDNFDRIVLLPYCFLGIHEFGDVLTQARTTVAGMRAARASYRTAKARQQVVRDKFNAAQRQDEWAPLKREYDQLDTLVQAQADEYERQRDKFVGYADRGNSLFDDIEILLNELSAAGALTEGVSVNEVVVVVRAWTHRGLVDLYGTLNSPTTDELRVKNKEVLEKLCKEYGHIVGERQLAWLLSGR